MAVPEYMPLAKMMSMRDELEVKSGVQITVVVKRHGRRGMRRVDCEGDQKELRPVKWMVVVVERKGERGIGADLGGFTSTGTCATQAAGDKGGGR